MNTSFPALGVKLEMYAAFHHSSRFDKSAKMFFTPLDLNGSFQKMDVSIIDMSTHFILVVGILQIYVVRFYQSHQRVINNKRKKVAKFM